MVDQRPSIRPVRVRFAPSPTGTLHVGSARTALYNFLFARHQGGSFILRIEDTDTARSTREYEESVLSDLAWLGLEWDEGPDIGGGFGPYRQSERSGLYHQAAAGLLAEGKAYHCFCSQERLEKMKERCLERNEMPKYDRLCESLAPEEVEARLQAGEPATIRFRIPDTDVAIDDIIHGGTSFSSDVIGDFIIIRSDGGVSYNFAVVVDDAAMEITHVIRGEDHLTNTARQVLVCQALGHEPPRYAHHSLILGPDGGKLSKRHGATSVGDFRAMGYLSAAIINYLVLLSWSPGEGEEKLDKQEMVRQFDIGGIARSAAIFDIQKLNWLNGLYIRDLSSEEFHEAIGPFLREDAPKVSGGQVAVAEAAIKTSLVTLAEATGQLVLFFRDVDLAGSEAAGELADPEAKVVLSKALGRLDDIPATAGLDADAAAGAIEAARELLGSLKAECKAEEIPPKRFFRTLRIALTGETSGPEVPFLLAGLGRETVRERLQAALEFAR